MKKTRPTTRSQINLFIIAAVLLLSLVLSCPTGYSGTLCDVPICWTKLATDATVCSQHGTCVAPDKCKCNEGHNYPAHFEILEN